MSKLLICKGLPASGKTTFARAWVNEAPTSRIRVNRDDIRRQLGPYWLPSREDLVTQIEDYMIAAGLEDDYDVIVDATNLRNGDRFDNLISALSVTVTIEVVDFTNISITTCIERDKLRPKEEQVGEEVIRNLVKKL